MTTRFLIIIGFFCGLFVTKTSGQITIGINAGINLATLSSERITNDRWEKGTGYRIGGFSETAFGKFGIRVEADYSYVPVKGLFDDRVDINYLSVPLTLFYSPIERLRFLAGPEINFLLGQCGPKYRLSMGHENFEKIDYGAHAEIEFEASKRLGISVRNYFGNTRHSINPTH